MSDSDATPDQVDPENPFAGPTTMLEIERDLAAPRGAVFRAFTEPELLSEWFGPHAFRVPLESVSIQAVEGGHQRFTMVHVDDPSITSPVEARFVELDEPRRIVGVQEVGPITMTMEVDIEAVPGGSRLRIRQHPHPERLLDAAKAGWGESFEKLDRALASRAD